MPTAAVRLLLSALLAVTLAACPRAIEIESADGRGVGDPGGVAEEQETPFEAEDFNPSEVEAQGDDLEVPLEVAEGPGGATLLYVPVFINGQGPYLFAVDTGASNSVLDREIADELALPQSGEETLVTGVGGPTTAQPVALGDWHAGEVPLPSGDYPAMELPETDRRFGLGGLIGSDILSAFEVVTVDYEREVIVLRAVDGRPAPAP